MAIYLGNYIEGNINSDNSSDENIEQLIDILKVSLSLSKVTKDYDIEKVNDLITIILSVKVIYFFIYSKHCILMILTILSLFQSIGWW